MTVYDSDYRKRTCDGTLYALSNQMTTSTGTVTLRAMFTNDDEVLFPNEFVNVRLLVDTLQNVVLVPTRRCRAARRGLCVSRQRGRKRFGA